jgi:asparagine synthase (glutamine-hydrolysing)
MCGIAGIIGPSASEDRVRVMAQLLKHRGPDGEGVWSGPGVALGHRRLAILDLSDAGRQPMELGPQVLTYNGELYNFRRLRESLAGPFRSNSDTEVLLHLLARDGAGCLEKLVGMFAFAVWDSGSRRLLAARDRLGIKPFYYRPMPQGLAFASELKALKALGPERIDPSAVRDFLTHGYIPAPKTIYREIFKLPAGHLLRFADGEVSIERYWNPSIEIVERSEQSALGELDDLLGTVVPEHTLADVPVGVFLSGGIDSAVTAYYLNKPRTYTLGFDAQNRSEADAARAVARHFGTIHSEMHTDGSGLATALERVSQTFDEPFGDSAAWSNYLISQSARREVTVALSGEGGDEIFCGYPRYWSHIGARSNSFSRSMARLAPPLSRFGQSMQSRAYTGLPAFAAALGGMNPVQIEALLGPDWLEADYDYHWFYRRFWREGLDPNVQLRWLDLNTDLAEGLLTKVDRTSMAHSLEVRPPLLDHRLVEYMLSVDPNLLVDERFGRGKVLLRTLMQPRLPPGHLDRPKSGFGLPLHRWIKRQPRILDEAVTRLIGRGILRQRVSVEFRRAWYLLVLDRWLTDYA